MNPSYLQDTNDFNRIIRYTALVLFLWNLPGFIIQQYDAIAISSPLSYLSMGLLVMYYLFNKRTSLNKWMISLGLLYFIISSLSGQQYMLGFIGVVVFWIKYFIVVVFGHEMMLRTSKNEMFVFLFIGICSLLLQVTGFFSLGENGRLAGFYNNPNSAGFICAMGYALSLTLHDRKWRMVGQLFFSGMGLLTFSRTFMIIWLLTSLLSIKIDIKNANKLLWGFGLLLTLIAFNELLPIQNSRISDLAKVVSGDSEGIEGLSQGNRFDTWSHFYDAVMDKPFFGNGFGSFGGGGVGGFLGAHNTFLRVIGEAGIIPFLLFIGYFVFLIVKGNSLFKRAPHIMLMAIAQMAFISTNHGYFTSEYSLLITLWLHTQILRYEVSDELKNKRAVTQ